MGQRPWYEQSEANILPLDTAVTAGKPHVRLEYAIESAGCVRLASEAPTSEEARANLLWLRDQFAGGNPAPAA